MPSFKFNVSSDELFGVERNDRVRCTAEDVAGIANAISAKLNKPPSSFDIDFYDDGGWLRLSADDFEDIHHQHETVKLRLRLKQAAQADPLPPRYSVTSPDWRTGRRPESAIPKDLIPMKAGGAAKKVADRKKKRNLKKKEAKAKAKAKAEAGTESEGSSVPVGHAMADKSTCRGSASMLDETVAGRGASLFSRLIGGVRVVWRDCGNEGDELAILPIAVIDLVSPLTFSPSFAYLGTRLLITLYHPSLYIRAYCRAGTSSAV
jgi:hypothetical protein